MPSKGRKYGKRKGGYRKKRYSRIKRAVKQVHHFKEMCRLPDITVAAASSTSNVLSGTLAMLTNSAQFRGLFDLYKITGVKFRFLYKYNSAEATIGGGAIPVLYTAINRDPFTPPPASVSDILNDDTCKIHRCDTLLGKGGRYIKSPKPDMSSLVTAQGVPTGGIVTQQWNLGLGNRNQYWLTTGGNAQALDQSGVGHFGLRYLLDNSQNTVSQVVEVYATLYFSMKEQD